MDEQTLKIEYVDEEGNPIEQIDWDIYEGVRTEEVYTPEGELSYLIMHCHKYTTREIAAIKIPELQQKLSETDYVVIKVAESQVTGVPLDDEHSQTYSEIITQREQWREEIRKYEAELEVTE